MDETQDRPRWAWWAAAALLGLFAALALVSRLPGIGVGNDDAMYLFLAKSLLQGSYRDIFHPDPGVHLQYPPGWPMLLAPALAVFGKRNAELLLFLPLLLSVGGLALLFDAARRFLPPVASLAVLAVAALNPLMVTFGGRLKSEAAFFFFVMLTVWALGAPRASRRTLLLGSGAAIAAAFMRTAGVAVIAAVLLHFALERRWRWVLGFGAVAAVTFGPWLAWSFVGPRQTLGRSYAVDLAIANREPMLAGRSPRVQYVLGAVLRLNRYVLGHLHAMMGFKQAQGTLIDNVGWVALLGSAGLAGLVVTWKRLRLLVLSLVGLLGILSIWTWADRRFLHPVVPLLGLVLMAGAHTLGRRLGRAGSAGACVLVLALLTPGTWMRTSLTVVRGWDCVRSADHRGCYNPIELSFLDLAEAARTLPDSAVVLTNREAAFAYHSGRRGVFVSEAGGLRGDELVAFLRNRGITHVAISRIGDTGAVELASQLLDLCGRLKPVATADEGAALYEILPTASQGEGPESVCAATARGLEDARVYQKERDSRFEFFRLDLGS